MIKIIELVAECIECGGDRVIQISEESKIKELFALCPICKVLTVV